MMKKIGVKGIMCTLLATFLFLSVGPSLVMPEAPETGSVCFYKDKIHCAGAATCCDKLASDVCCKNSKPSEFGFSADVSSPGSTGEVTLCQSRNCSTSCSVSFGYMCYNADFSSVRRDSGKWTIIGRRDGAELGSEKPCNKTVSTDTLQYTFITEDRRRPSWMLPMASLTEADSNGPLRDLPAEEQVIWFKSRGATLKVEDHQTTPVADYNAYSPAPD